MLEISCLLKQSRTFGCRVDRNNIKSLSRCIITNIKEIFTAFILLGGRMLCTTESLLFSPNVAANHNMVKVVTSAT